MNRSAALRYAAFQKARKAREAELRVIYLSPEQRETYQRGKNRIVRLVLGHALGTPS